MAEFYVVASEAMVPVEAVGPFPERELAARVVVLLRRVKRRFSLSIATRQPPGIPIMPPKRFAAELDAAIHRERVRSAASSRAATREEAP